MGALSLGQGVVYANRQAPTASNWMTPGYVDGRKKVMLDYYVGLGSEASGSTLLMGAQLPVGAKVIAVNVHVNASTSSLTISVGDCNSATRYGSALTGPATGPSVTKCTGLIDATNGFYLIGQNTSTTTSGTTGGDSQILLTTGGATLTQNQIYGVEVEYTTD
jgi:hypothetical protein